MINIGLSRAADVFVDIYVSQDQKDAEKRMMHFDQGGLGLGSTARDYYLNDTRYGKQLAAYERYMSAKVSLIAEDAESSRTKRELNADVKEMIRFEKEFARILTPEEDRRNYTKMYNVRRFSDLSKLLPLVSTAHVTLSSPHAASPSDLRSESLQEGFTRKLNVIFRSTGIAISVL